jgi:hypothetical protein
MMFFCTFLKKNSLNSQQCLFLLLPRWELLQDIIPKLTISHSVLMTY